MASPLADGQTAKGTILGTITDSSQAVVPAAKVTLTETNTNARRMETTNESGYYVFANLDPGTYEVQVEQTGFHRIIRGGVDLLPNTTARVDLELVPGTVSEVIDVSAQAPLLQTDRADTGGKLEQQQIQTMPLPFNRNYQGLLMLVPGVSRPLRAHSEFYNSQDSLSSRVNGQGRQANNYQIEGIDNNIDSGNLTGIVPPAEAIASVDVSTSNYDPELGRSGGAVINVTLRSGNNNFHGSLFEFHQDAAIRARQVFANAKPAMVYNQFGGTFGGRIIRDRLFFFGDYQGTRDHFGNSNLATIPTLAFRAGDLSASPTPIYDPNTGNPDGTGRVQFTNNQIPLNRIDSQVQKILSFLPPPTSSALQTNFQKNTVRIKTLNLFDTKIDYVLSVNDRLAVRYSYQKAFVFDPGLFGPNGGIYGGPHNAGFSGSGPALTDSPSVTYSHVFSPSLVTEARLGFVHNHNVAQNTDFGLTTSRDIGIPGVNIDPRSSGLTQILINGYSPPLVGYDPNLPWIRAVTNIGAVNNWTKTLGTHILRFGMEIRRVRNDILFTDPPRGQFTFTEGPTALNGNARTSFANAFASFLLDQPNSILRGLAETFPARRELLYGLHFQDKWQISKKLTVDLGLRWEYWPAATPRFAGGFSNYNPSNNTLEVAGIGKIPRNMGVKDTSSFGPRFGIAYRLNEKTVLRGGYGISYFPRDLGLGQPFNFPVRQSNSFNAANSFVAVGSLATGIPPPDPAQIPASGILPAPLTQSLAITPLDLFRGYVQSWNVAVQRALPGNFSLEAAYVGNHAVNVRTTYQLNHGLVLGAGRSGQPLFQRFGRQTSTTTYIGTHSYYDGLHVRFDRKFGGGFLLTTSYTYSKAIDFCTDLDCSPYNMFDIRSNKARSDFDVTHVYTQSFVYELPFGAGKRWLRSGIRRWVLGDWQSNGVVTAQTGTPLSITFSNSTLNTPFVNNRPNLIGNATPAVYGKVGQGALWFDTSMFVAPAPGTLGNVGRNILTGPGLWNLDFSLFRNFSFTERLKGQLRLESFNSLNTPHYDNPGTTLGSANFGQVTTAGGNYATGRGDPRQYQIGLRLYF